MSQKNIKLLITRKNRFQHLQVHGGLGERFFKSAASGHVPSFSYLNLSAFNAVVHCLLTAVLSVLSELKASINKPSCYIEHLFILGLFWVSLFTDVFIDIFDSEFYIFSIIFICLYITTYYTAVKKKIRVKLRKLHKLLVDDFNSGQNSFILVGIAAVFSCLFLLVLYLILFKPLLLLLLLWYAIILWGVSFILELFVY